MDFVIVSHSHYDHLDKPSVMRILRRWGSRVRWYVPLGLAEWFRKRGARGVTELDWWEGVRHPGSGVDITLTPAQHWSKRKLIGDINRSLWGSFAVTGRSRFFFAGDTGYCPAFREIGERLGPFDLAAIPIGAYGERRGRAERYPAASRGRHRGPVLIHTPLSASASFFFKPASLSPCPADPRWFMAPQHVDPFEAVQIHLDVRARRSVPIHWGTFGEADARGQMQRTHPPDTPPMRCAPSKGALVASSGRVPMHGDKGATVVLRGPPCSPLAIQRSANGLRIFSRSAHLRGAGRAPDQTEGRLQQGGRPLRGLLPSRARRGHHRRPIHASTKEYGGQAAGLPAVVRMRPLARRLAALDGHAFGSGVGRAARLPACFLNAHARGQPRSTGGLI